MGVEAASLVEIDSFTLRTSNGETLTFLPAPDASQDAVAGILPGHLQRHAAFGDQVEVFYRAEAGALLAVRIEDRQGVG